MNTSDYQFYYEMQEYLKKLNALQEKAPSDTIQAEISRITSIMENAIQEVSAQFVGKRAIYKGFKENREGVIEAFINFNGNFSPYLRIKYPKGGFDVGSLDYITIL